MGTRADFYIGRNRNAVWLGSIAWDGYPNGIPKELLAASTDDEFKAQVAALANRDDFTAPEMGWPWPWNDSNTTDFAYAIDDGKVYASCFGKPWFDPQIDADEDEDGDPTSTYGEPRFPDMSDRKNFTLGERSGVIVMRGQS